METIKSATRWRPKQARTSIGQFRIAGWGGRPARRPDARPRPGPPRSGRKRPARAEACASQLSAVTAHPGSRRVRLGKCLFRTTAEKGTDSLRDSWAAPRTWKTPRRCRQAGRLDVLPGLPRGLVYSGAGTGLQRGEDENRNRASPQDTNGGIVFLL